MVKSLPKDEMVKKTAQQKNSPWSQTVMDIRLQHSMQKSHQHQWSKSIMTVYSMQILQKLLSSSPSNRNKSSY